ncbi:MAG TPA: hypothetical protein VFV54_07340, partial [Thermoanaerobaculia bacterium]|nr:hypothetical protein [Thermoanaerobaculia bacterium]
PRPRTPYGQDRPSRDAVPRSRADAGPRSRATAPARPHRKGTSAPRTAGPRFEGAPPREGGGGFYSKFVGPKKGPKRGPGGGGKKRR